MQLRDAVDDVTFVQGRFTVATSRQTFTFLLIGAVCSLVACGGNSSSSHPAQPSIAIALNPAPTSTSVPVGNTAGITFTPVISNDAGNYGVDWAITCPLSTVSASACGTLSIAPSFHSTSGTAVSYIPPATMQTGSLSVNVTVFATADHTRNVSTPVTVTSYTDVLKGTYVLQVMGADGSQNPYQTTGVFVFDGNGNIPSGEQTINSSSSGFFSSQYTVQDSTVTASTYFIGADGRGTMNLNLRSSLGTNVETLSFVVLSTSKAMVAELDGNSASGTLELQDSNAASAMPMGAFAFVTTGSDAGSAAVPGGGIPVPTAIGGVFNIDNTPLMGYISGNGSLADQDYYNTKATKRALQSCVPPLGVTGSVSPPDSMGAVTITLTGTTCFGILGPASIQYTGYIVDATHIRLIESDDVNGTSGFLTAGLAVSQGSAAGTFTNASLAGPYAFGVLGYDINAAASSTFTSAGVFNADGIGSLTGINDTLYFGDSAAFTANALTGTYSMDSGLIGRAALTLKFKGPSPKPKTTVLLYLTGDGTPPLMLWSEGEDINFPAIGTGIADPQSANASTLSFGSSEKYGVSFAQSVGAEVDGTGQMTSAVTGVTGTITGTVDDLIDSLLTGGTPFLLTDTFTLPADSFGRIAGTFKNTAGTAGPFVEYYLVDDNHGFFVETDLLNTTLGSFAQACDVTNISSCQAAARQSSAHAVRSRRSNITKNPPMATH